MTGWFTGKFGRQDEDAMPPEEDWDEEGSELDELLGV